MILKGSQRGSGQNLAAHLMKLDDNEHMELHQLRGFVADDLKGAFKEIEAISLGTRCRNYLFSLSLNPPESSRVTVEEFEAAIDKVERSLGLNDQPRAVVFHEKEGRRHAHCVWSRIDAETMTARQLPFFKNRLMDVSKELYLQHGWTMPKGMLDRAMRDPARFTLAEWQQAKRSGLDPRILKQVVQQSWQASDGAKAFAGALQDRGLFLAKGDRRDFVVMDHNGDVHSLPRLLNLKSKEVRERLGEPKGLKSVADTSEDIGRKMTPAIRTHIAEAKGRHSEAQSKLTDRRLAMVVRHRQERAQLRESQREQWRLENIRRQERLPRGLRGLWHRITGRYQEIRRENEIEASLTILRHVAEREQLTDRQRTERAQLQHEIRSLRSEQAKTLLALRGDIGRFLKLTRGTERDRDLSQSLTLKLQR